MSTNVYISETYFSAFFNEISPRRLFKRSATITVVMAMMRTITIATTPPIIVVVLLEELLSVEPSSSLAVTSTLGSGIPGTVVVRSVGVVIVEEGVGSVSGGCVGEHSPSLREEMATEHSESTVISTPVTMILAPPLTHCSIREISDPLSVSDVPSSLALYLTSLGDSS